VHRHSEDLLRIERQLGKAGLGKRLVIPKEDYFNSTLLFYTPLVRFSKAMSHSVCLLSLSQAYVQQLESSRVRLNQLEQDLQRARTQVRENKTTYAITGHDIAKVFKFKHLWFLQLTSNACFYF